MVADAAHTVRHSTDGIQDIEFIQINETIFACLAANDEFDGSTTT